MPLSKQDSEQLGSEPSIVAQAIKRASEIYLPLNVTVELSQACNLRCTHCYNFDRKLATRPTSEKPALTPDEIKRVLREIRLAGGIAVAFSGGEALLHPHLHEFIAEARRLSLAVRIKSNGTLISPKRAVELARAGATELEVSLYGASPKTHDTFTRVPGSFEKTLLGVQNARAAGISPTVNFILHHDCVPEFDAMMALAESLDVPFAMSTELTKRYDGTEDSLEQRLTADDLNTLYSGKHKEYFAGSFNDRESVQCACARTNAGIGFDGTVYPCIGAPIPSGDVRQESFEQIWRNSKVFGWIRDLSLQSFKECAPCGLRRYCQRSSGATYTNTGDYTGKEEWNCMQAGLLKTLNDSLENKSLEI